MERKACFMTFDITLTKEGRERLLAIAFADNGPSPLWQKILVQSRTHDNDDPVGKIIDTSLDYDFIKMEP